MLFEAKITRPKQLFGMLKKQVLAAQAVLRTLDQTIDLKSFIAPEEAKSAEATVAAERARNGRRGHLKNYDALATSGAEILLRNKPIGALAEDVRAGKFFSAGRAIVNKDAAQVTSVVLHIMGVKGQLEGCDLDDKHDLYLVVKKVDGKAVTFLEHRQVTEIDNGRIKPQATLSAPLDLTKPEDAERLLGLLSDFWVKLAGGVGADISASALQQLKTPQKVFDELATNIVVAMPAKYPRPQVHKSLALASLES